MYLHVMNADSKFVGPITRMFEAAAPGMHEYIAVGSVGGNWIPAPGVVHVPDGPAAAAIAARRVDWDGVLVHGLPFSTARPIMKVLAPTVAVAWYVWGFEAYEAWPALQRGLLMPKTRAAEARLSGLPLTGRVRRAWRQLRDNPRDVLDRYDFCVTQIREEYELFVATGLLTSTQFHWGAVGMLDDYADTGASASTGRDIQVGNSATFSNNHLDVFDTLSRMDLGTRCVVAPLGYGDSRYRAVVTDAGKRLLGERFRPLEEFVPLEEYRTILRQCGHVIMNQSRQQALGNIIEALWRGARVYLNDTTVYRALVGAGYDVDLIEGSVRAGGSFDCASAKVLRNRELLREQLGTEHVVDETMKLLDVLSNGRVAYA